jgi:hypothetical protein
VTIGTRPDGSGPLIDVVRDAVRVAMSGHPMDPGAAPSPASEHSRGRPLLHGLADTTPPDLKRNMPSADAVTVRWAGNTSKDPRWL